MALCRNSPPDPSKGYEAGILADLQALPWRRILEAAATTGTPASIQVPGTTTPINVDFTGMGEGDYNRQYADQMAQSMLALQQQFGPQYVQERLAELQQSDPEGAAMRSRLWDAIRSDVGEAQTANRPAADELQSLIQSELEQGGTLDPATALRVSQGVRGQQVALGQYGGNAATTQEATALANASEGQRSQRQQEALAFLTSGASPEDVAYRREQQALGNLGAFVGGQTPEAQFGELSGAQNQIVPFMGSSSPLPGVNPNAGFQGIDYANSLYSANMNWRNSTVNPYLAGLTGGIGGVNVWAGLGGRAGAGVASPTPQNVQTGGWAGVDTG